MRLMPSEKLVWTTEWATRPSDSRQTCSSVRAMGSFPVSIGRSPRLLMNAETRAFDGKEK